MTRVCRPGSKTPLRVHHLSSIHSPTLLKTLKHLELQRRGLTVQLALSPHSSRKVAGSIPKVSSGGLQPTVRRTLGQHENHRRWTESIGDPRGAERSVTVCPHLLVYSEGEAGLVGATQSLPSARQQARRPPPEPTPTALINPSIVKSVALAKHGHAKYTTTATQPALTQF